MTAAAPVSVAGAAGEAGVEALAVGAVVVPGVGVVLPPAGAVDALDALEEPVDEAAPLQPRASASERSERRGSRVFMGSVLSRGATRGLAAAFPGKSSRRKCKRGRAARVKTAREDGISVTAR
jgi:hypothetical protein